MAGANFFARTDGGGSPGPDRAAIDEAANPAAAGPGADAATGTTARGSDSPLPGTGTGPKRRGRPPGSGNNAASGSERPSGKKNKSNLAGSIEQLSRTLIFTSMGFSILAPELLLSEQEAGAITGALVNLLEVYDVKPDPKVEAWAGVILTLGPITATKGFQIRNRRRKERAEKRAQPAPTPEMKTARTTNGSGAPVEAPGEPIDMLHSTLGGGGPEGRG